MSKKIFSLKNYLKPIDLEYNEQEQEDFLRFLEKNTFENYPFSKEELIQFLSTEECLSLINSAIIKSSNEIENSGKNTLKTKENISVKNILENLPSELKQDQIKDEKRKRNQAYKMLDYTLSNYTYFDFFSADAFQIAKNSKYIAQLYKKEKVTPEILFLCFFDNQFEVSNLLKSFGFEEEFIEKLAILIKTTKTREQIHSEQKSFIYQFKKTISHFFKGLFTNEKKELIFNQKIKYTYQVHQIFEKSSENAQDRFKTPVITPEILLITLMEEKGSIVNKLIKKNINDDTNWYLLRYQLLKRLYSQESNVREQVKRNQQFFAYLLKVHLSDSSFEKLIEKKLLSDAVALFRNLLIHDLLKFDLFDDFEQEIHAALHVAPKRFYSK